MLRISTSGFLNGSVRSALPRRLTKATTTRAASSSISKCALAHIERRWEGMPMQEQADLWMALRDRMKGNWSDLTLQEKRVAYWISFGPHGPRAEDPPGENMKIFLGIVVGLLVSAGIFGTARAFAGQAPQTMTKEWQEKTNEMLKARGSDPITGIGSPDYEGPGHVQSPPARG